MTSRKLGGAFALGAMLWLAGCSDDATEPSAPTTPELAVVSPAAVALAAEVRNLATANGITPSTRC